MDRETKDPEIKEGFLLKFVIMHILQDPHNGSIQPRGLGLATKSLCPWKRSVHNMMSEQEASCR